MGFLTAAGALPGLLIGLFAGAWIDQFRRRPILIAADFGRAAILALIPIAALLGVLRIEQLYLSAFLVGTLSLFFDVAQRSYLPSLIEKNKLIDGNSKLEMSRSIAEIAGPGAAGGLVEQLTAPVAIAVDSISFLVSGFFIWLIKTPELAPSLPSNKARIWQEIEDGLKFVLRQSSLRALLGCLGIVHLFNSSLEAVFVLFLTRDLGISPGLLGLAFAIGGVGFLVGTLLIGLIVRKVGFGPGIMAGLILFGFSDLLVPLLAQTLNHNLIFAVLVAAQFFFGLGLVMFNIGQVSLRQALTSDRYQGRMNATFSFIAGATVPLGGLLGGLLGESLGLRATLLLSAFGEMLGVLWLLFSPLRSLREQPTEVS
jgi:MFS family permease